MRARPGDPIIPLADGRILQLSDEHSLRVAPEQWYFGYEAQDGLLVVARSVDGPGNRMVQVNALYRTAKPSPHDVDVLRRAFFLPSMDVEIRHATRQEVSPNPFVVQLRGRLGGVLIQGPWSNDTTASP